MKYVDMEDCVVSEIPSHRYEGLLPRGWSPNFLVRVASSALCLAACLCFSGLQGLPAQWLAGLASLATLGIALDALLGHSGTAALDPLQHQRLAWEQGRLAWERLMRKGLGGHLESLGAKVWGGPRAKEIASDYKEMYKSARGYDFGLSCTYDGIYVSTRNGHSYSFSWNDIRQAVGNLEAEPEMLPLHAVAPAGMHDPEDMLRCALALTLLGALA